MGLKVDVHPEVAKGPGRPDFRIRGEQTFYVEATTVFSGIVEEGRHGERESWILDALNEAKSANFFVWVHFENVGVERPRIRQVVAPVEDWLESLDPDEVAASINTGQRPPARRFGFRDWRIRLEALPKRAAARGDPSHRLVGVGPMSVGFVNDREMLQKALDRKKRRHSKVDAPLILAVLGMSPVLDEEDVAQALFGTEAVVIDSGALIRRPDGFWQTTRGPSARDVSAVIVGAAINPWSVTPRWPRLWLNPWANRTLQENLPFPSAHVEADRLVFTDDKRPPYEVLGLPPGWPGDPASRFDAQGD